MRPARRHRGQRAACTSRAEKDVSVYRGKCNGAPMAIDTGRKSAKDFPSKSGDLIPSLPLNDAGFDRYQNVNRLELRSHFISQPLGFRIILRDKMGTFYYIHSEFFAECKQLLNGCSSPKKDMTLITIAHRETVYHAASSSLTGCLPDHSKGISERPGGTR